MLDWVRDVLRRKPKPQPVDDELEAKVTALSQRAHAVVAHAGRTLQEARKLDDEMRAAEQAVRRA